jgi:hypothetical protein
VFYFFNLEKLKTQYFRIFRKLVSGFAVRSIIDFSSNNNSNNLQDFAWFASPRKLSLHKIGYSKEILCFIPLPLLSIFLSFSSGRRATAWESVDMWNLFLLSILYVV